MMEYERSIFENGTDGGTIKFNDVHNWNASSFQDGDKVKLLVCFLYGFAYVVIPLQVVRKCQS